jgi:hypothetical protein
VAVAPTLQVEIPMAVVAASSPDPSVGEEGLQANLDTAAGADASSLDPKATRILLEVVTTTWKGHRSRGRCTGQVTEFSKHLPQIRFKIVMEHYWHESLYENMVVVTLQSIEFTSVNIDCSFYVCCIAV